MEKYKDTAISILSSVAALAVVSFPVWFMWNWLIPNIFGLQETKKLLPKKSSPLNLTRSILK